MGVRTVSSKLVKPAPAQHLLPPSTAGTGTGTGTGTGAGASFCGHAGAASAAEQPLQKEPPAEQQSAEQTVAEQAWAEKPPAEQPPACTHLSPFDSIILMTSVSRAWAFPGARIDAGVLEAAMQATLTDLPFLAGRCVGPGAEWAWAVTCGWEERHAGTLLSLRRCGVLLVVGSAVRWLDNWLGECASCCTLLEAFHPIPLLSLYCLSTCPSLRPCLAHACPLLPPAAPSG